MNGGVPSEGLNEQLHDILDQLGQDINLLNNPDNIQHIMFLLQAGADKNTKGIRDGKTLSYYLDEKLFNILNELAIDRSLLDNYAQHIMFLLGAGANRDTKNRYGKTLLHYLYKRLSDILDRLASNSNLLGDSNFTQHIMFLLQAGADPNVQNQAGKTLLHYVAERNDIDGIKFLLQKGADPNVRDLSGKIPSDYATEHCLQVLKDCGYDLGDSHGNEGNPATPDGSVGESNDCSNSSGDDSQVKSVKLSDCNTEEDSDYHSDSSCENEENPANNSSNYPNKHNDDQALRDDPGYGSGDDNKTISTKPSDCDRKDEDSSCSSNGCFFLEDSLLAKLGIPLTTDEQNLIGKFCEKIENTITQNKQKPEESILKSIEETVNNHLNTGARLNSLCCDECKSTVTNLILGKIGDVLDDRVKPRDETREYRGGVNDITNQDDEDKDEALEITGSIIRNLFLKGGKAKEEFFYTDTELANNCGFDCANLSAECEEIESKLISIAYGGIVNKNEQAQKGEPEEVDIDNIYFYIKYSQDSIIEPMKIFNKAEALKDKALNLKVGILQIGESIVRVEGAKDGKRNYTDVLEGSIKMSFATEVGEISIYLSPSEKDGNKIEVEIDEESEARLNKLKAEKKSLGENCLLGGKSVLEAIEAKGFKKNGNVPTEPTETIKGVPFTGFTQACLQQIDTSVKGR